MTSNEQAFLATTALEEYWDKTKPLVFLGEHCRLYARRASWEGGTMLSSPYKDEAASLFGARYVDSVYERVLRHLGDALNELHGTRHGPRYWRILLGPWLHIYVSVVYDAYLHLQTALQQYPACTTLVLPPESWVTPNDTADFNLMVCYEDAYHLQIYTRILAFLGKSFPAGPKLGEGIRPSHAGRHARKGLRRNLKDLVTKTYAMFYARFFHSIALRYAYFPRKAELQIIAATHGGVLPIVGEPAPMRSFSSDEGMRRRLQGISSANDKFETCLLALLPFDLPRCFVEGFAATRAAAARVYPDKVRAIFSSNAWYTDEPFKFWAAASAENGTLLLAGQHGGNYGSVAVMPSEDHEAAIADHYYTWGWKREGCHAKVIPMPGCILTGRERQGAGNSKTGILWVPTQHYRYLIQFVHLPIYVPDYISWQHRFAKALNKDTRAEVRIRHKPVDFGWALAQRLEDNFPDLRADPLETPFSESLKNCRLYVCDHLSTTFLEALYINKPTILFWDPELNMLREDARPFYQLLREAGILFDTPEEAAEAVTKVYHDVETWWNAPDRQAAVQRFCARFAMSLPDPVEAWAAEFRKIAD